MIEAILVVMWSALTAYALFGGADFGGGFWDLLAGGSAPGAPRRALIEKTIGPVWEANHVWLIFILVVLWTAFPRAFAQLTSTLIIPFTAAAIGIILRGSAFAFRKSVTKFELRRGLGAAFATSSMITPFFLGAIAGAVASGRIPATGVGDLAGSWLNPTSVLGGTLAVLTCAYLAAVFLTADAARFAPEQADWFRTRALGTAVVTGGVALLGIAVLRADAPTLFEGLTGRAAPLIAASALGGLASMWLLWHRRFQLARLAAVVAVAAIVWGWGAAQYPWLLTDTLLIGDGAGASSTLRALLVGLGVGAVLFLPPLAYLLLLSQRGELRDEADEPVGSPQSYE